MKLRVPFFQKTFKVKLMRVSNLFQNSCKVGMPSLRGTAGGGKASCNNNGEGRANKFLWGGSVKGKGNGKESKGGVGEGSANFLWGGSVKGNGNGKESKPPRAGSVSRKHSVMGSIKARSGKKHGGAHERVSQWMQQVSALEMQEMEEAFNFFDDDKDGKITAAELVSALRRLGENPTLEQVKEMMKEADANGDGVISFDEFLTLQSGVGSIHRQDAIFRQDVKQAFSRFDADGNGLISPEELQGVLGRLGHPSTLADCSRMISRVDLDGDGQINFEEFFSMMRE